MLTAEQILALAPDESSAKAARGLLSPAQWPTLGHDAAAIWGECKGSGARPYQVIIDVGGPSFRCTCPSRKFPCKHGLALYLLLAQQANAFQANTPPAWVTEWLSARQQRAEQKAAKATPAEARPADPEAAAKREAKRQERMLAGARDLERWMVDLVRHGIADLPGKPEAFWREAAARLVDAQAGGLAAGVRQLEGAVASGAGWQQRALLVMGRLQLLVEAMQRLDQLPAPLQDDVRASAGLPLDAKEVLATGERVADRWRVLGIGHDEHDKLWERRVWLRGAATGRCALLLDFSHGGRHFEHVFVPGSGLQATLCYHASALPLRALLVEPPVATAPAVSTEACTTWDTALGAVADAIARQPWLQRLPLTLHHATPTLRGSHWHCRDAAGREAPLRVGTDDGWQLMALGGGHPLTIFGEWLGDQLRPLSAWRDTQTAPCWTEVVQVA